MKVVKVLVIAVLVGIIAAGVLSQFTTSKYPPCDLVAQGITVSTYGCSNAVHEDDPCMQLAPKSSEMISCVQANYYRVKTFPFGFKQHFGPHSNVADSTLINENRLAVFGLAFVITLIVLGVATLRNKSS